MTNKEKSRIQKEIVDSLEPKPHGRLLLAPRVGKSKLAIDIIKKNKPAVSERGLRAGGCV